MTIPRAVRRTVFEIRTKNCLANVESGGSDRKRQNDTDDGVVLHLSGDRHVIKAVLLEFVSDDWWSKILPNAFKSRSLVKSKRRSEAHGHRSSYVL
jgi:hypothetical protein